MKLNSMDLTWFFDLPPFFFLIPNFDEVEASQFPSSLPFLGLFWEGLSWNQQQKPPARDSFIKFWPFDHS